MTNVWATRHRLLTERLDELIGDNDDDLARLAAAGYLLLTRHQVNKRGRCAVCEAFAVAMTQPFPIVTAWLADVPAEVVLLVGILGNISDTDLARTIATAPALCRPAATLLWSRARAGGDLNDMVRARFAAAGFTELDYATLDRDTWPAVGVVRYDGPPMPLPTGKQLFTFLR